MIGKIMNESDDLTPEYEPNSGLNHTLRLNGLSFIYDPEFHDWVHDRWVDGLYRPIRLTGDQIHRVTLDGTHRLTTWEEGV